MSVLAERLRALQDRNNWTVADMSERTGIPKRTLDKYLLRREASLPGFDALCQISKGLGVSLDWLVFGSEAAGEVSALYAEKATFEVVRELVETVLAYHRDGKELFRSDDELLALNSLEWGHAMGDRAADMVRDMAKEGVTKESLLTWKQGIYERSVEALNARFDRIKERQS